MYIYILAEKTEIIFSENVDTCMSRVSCQLLRKEKLHSMIHTILLPVLLNFIVFSFVTGNALIIFRLEIQRTIFMRLSPYCFLIPKVNCD